MQETARFYGLQTDRREWLAARSIIKKRRALKFIPTIFTASAAGQQAIVRALLQSCLISHSMGNKKRLWNLIIERFNWFSVLKLD